MAIKMTSLIKEVNTTMDKFTKLHNDLLKHFKKLKDVEKVDDYGPEENKWNSNAYDSQFSIRSKDVVVGNSTSSVRITINLTYDTKHNKTTLFIPDKGYFYFKDVPTFQKIMNTIRKEVDSMKI